MSIFEAIVQWSKSIPAWQQDAIVRLFFQDGLESNDYSELYALLKTSQGIEAPEGLVAKALVGNQVPAAPAATSPIQLVAIRDLLNVNALAAQQVVSIAPTGLTAIYGPNGSGKSGYSRVLKKACRARDQSEKILPNASLPKGTVSKPRAKFDLIVDGEPVEIDWEEGQATSDLMSSIAIFDAHCARAYIDDQDDFSYVPYGLDILESLAQACKKLEGMLDEEYGKSGPNSMPFSSLIGPSTEVGKILGGLSANTKPAQIETLATLSAEELSRYSVLDKGLKERSPKERAKQLQLSHGRINRLRERCTQSLNSVSDVAVATLRDLVQASRAARTAADFAAEKFKQTPGLLPGTGGDAWQELFAAARKFAEESHPGQHFPNLSPDSGCPLCQQILGDSAQRLVEFDEFIQQEAEKNARLKREAAKVAYTALINADMNIQFDAELKVELEALDADLSAECEAFQLILNDRRAAVKLACGDGGDWGTIDSAAAGPGEPLLLLCIRLLAEISALEKASDESQRSAMEAEFAELHARQQLSVVTPAVLEAISMLQMQKKLNSCRALVRTAPISSKSTELVNSVVSKGLADALNAEFARLNVGHLHVSLRSSTVKGKTLHKLVIELPGATVPRDILSEGEQRAIAIASFLAEINIGNRSGGAIFDDPMSSLDHRRRELIARRLVEESAKRQVIVFTHDLYFLSLLQQDAQSLSSPFSSLSLRRSPAGFGVVSDSLPFDGANTKTRIGMLKQIQVECEALHKANDEEVYASRVRFAYQRLRDAWERAVEEVLFNGVIWRFRSGVSTQSLREVAVEDPDYAAINGGMSQCSKYAHDGSANAIVSVPLPAELMADIKALADWRDDAITRRKQLIQKRPK